MKIPIQHKIYFLSPRLLVTSIYTQTKKFLLFLITLKFTLILFSINIKQIITLVVRVYWKIKKQFM